MLRVAMIILELFLFGDVLRKNSRSHGNLGGGFKHVLF